MPRLIINGTPVDAPENATLLNAAASIGIQVPTLCHIPGGPPLTSCMICVVEDVQANRLLPACAARAEEGMVIETESESVCHARRSVLEMLLSEHVGDCVAPCERACPAGLNIPLMLRLIARGELEQARAMAHRTLVLPAVLGRICTAPCEAGCRRASLDAPVAIRELHGVLGEGLFSDEAEAPGCLKSSGKKIAIIGAGPAGLAAAFALQHYGHACRVYEKGSRPGGRLLDYGEEQLSRDVLEKDFHHLVRAGVEFEMNTEVGKTLSVDDLIERYDAVIAACSLPVPEHPEVFLAKEKNMPVRSVASGKEIAEIVHKHLSREIRQEQPSYHSIIGRVQKEQAISFAENRISDAALSRSRNASLIKEEAERCLHCDCHAPISCKLRDYAARYGARPKRFRNAERQAPGGIKRYGDVIYDAGKCIKCGICVEITRTDRNTFGMSFSGRGFTMEVIIPFGESLEKALSTCAEECVALCPTGALAFETTEERTVEPTEI